MLIADRYKAECRKPKYKPKEELLILEGNAFCAIVKESSGREINEIKLRFKRWFSIIKTKINETIKWRELSIRNCICDTKKVHDKHTGSGRAIPFKVDRTSKPAICMQIPRADLELYATVIQANL